MTVRPSGFFQPEAILARNLFGATPADAVSRVSSRIALEAPRDRDAERLAPGVLGDVEVRLVERQRLDQRRHGPKQLVDRLGHAPVLPKSGFTTTSSGHRRTAGDIGIAERTPKRARLVARGADDAALAARPPTATGVPRSVGSSRCSTDA